MRAKLVLSRGYDSRSNHRRGIGLTDSLPMLEKIINLNKLTIFKYLGLPTKGAEKEWREFRTKYIESKQEFVELLNNYLKERSVQPLSGHLFINHSPYLNVYPYPRELDYTDIRPLPPKWVQFDNLMRVENDLEFKVPEVLRNKPGKLIFLSMGSMGSADVDLMKRLIGFLSECKHRLIVSKGPLSDRYELGHNMW